MDKNSVIAMYDASSIPWEMFWTKAFETGANGGVYFGFLYITAEN
jgi:hypothetical protein